ncbi:conserved hypothetical protein [Paraburkholderia caribensis]|nr:conserved hypothetical protein [Paraburkholderia caribensis]
MQETMTLTFRRPITVGKGENAKTYTELQLREPLAGDYEQAEKSGGKYGFVVALVAIVSGVPIDVVDELFSSEIDEAEDFFSGFADEAVLMPDVRSPDEFSLELQAPVKLTDDATALNATKLDLCEPTNLQRRKARQAGGPFASSIELISIVARVPRKTVRALSARDFHSATGYFNGFQIRRRPD